jgi:hypothetical protein
MKFLSMLALLALAPLARSDETPPNPGPALPACSDNSRDISADPKAIMAAIKNAQFCWQAVQLTENCSGGDSEDFNFVGAAAPLCAKEFEAQNPSSQDRIVLASMRTACDGKWKEKAGGQYLSQNALCKLHAWLWVDNLTSENPAKQF